MEDKKVTYFRTYWKQVEDGQQVLIETINGISRVLFKEGIKYRLQAGGTTRDVSYHRARTLIHDMVARILDEERSREERSEGERR